MLFYGQADIALKLLKGEKQRVRTKVKTTVK